MQDHMFIDGVGEVRLVDGVIRMDLVALSARKRTEKGGQPPEFVTQLVMSPPAFVRMIRSLGGTVNSLRERGILRDDDTEGSAESEAEDSQHAPSPNFR